MMNNGKKWFLIFFLDPNMGSICKILKKMGKSSQLILIYQKIDTDDQKEEGLGEVSHSASIQ